MAVSDYDITPANNTTISGTGIQGSNNVQNFDNALRQLMADLAGLLDGNDSFDSFTTIGSITVGTTAVDAVINHAVQDRSVAFSGGNSATDGGNLLGFGSTHATQAGDFVLRSNSNYIYWFDRSADQHYWYDVSGTQNMTLDANGDLYTTGSLTLGSGSSYRYIKTTYITDTDATWDFDNNTVRAEVFLLGGGGAGGYASSGAGTSGYAGTGGNSGGWLRKEIDVAALGASPTAAIVIGTGGVATTSTAPDGVDTTYDDGTTSLTAQGGAGGNTDGGDVIVPITPTQNTATTGGDTNHIGNLGGKGLAGGERSDSSGVFSFGSGGHGGNSPYGQGGAGGSIRASSATGVAGSDASGYGAGGGGGGVAAAATVAGGDGGAGLCIIVEYGF